MTSEPAEPIKIFYCYAREDKDMRDELELHLAPLRRAGEITTWYDREIQPGTEWAREIDTHLDTADIILLLLSPHFIASDYCWGVEMRKALERYEAGEAHVIPILLRRVILDGIPISHLQYVPTDGKPINRLPLYERDDAFWDVAKGIQEVVRALRHGQFPSPLQGIPLNRPPGTMTLPKEPDLGDTPPSPVSTPEVVSQITPGKVVYGADWSKGMNKWRPPKDWLGESIWTPRDGMLHCNGGIVGNPTGPNIVLAPYLPQTDTYAIEAQIRVLRLLPQISHTYFGLVVRKSPHAPGYMAGVGGNFSLVNAVFWKWTGMTAEESYEPAFAWHTYRVEVKHNTMTLFIDGKYIFEVTNDPHPFESGKQVGLACSACELVVRSFQIMEYSLKQKN